MNVPTESEMKNDLPEPFARIADYVFDLVRTGVITVGEELPSAVEIAAATDVDESDAAAALVTMESLCLIERRCGTGPYIFGNVANSFTHTFDVMHMLNVVGSHDVGAFRKSMELAVYDLAFRRKDKKRELRKMKEVLDAFPKGKLEEQIRLDQKFHYLLTEMADNGIMTMLMSSIFEIYRRWITRVLGFMSDRGMHRLHSAHVKIYESLLHNDKASGLEAIDEHYYLIELAEDEQENAHGTLPQS
ncbi:MAG: FCD domain-containing protein [Pyramidobacter sp.]